MDTDTRIWHVEEELRVLQETVARLPAEIERQRLALEGREGGDPITESWAHVDRERAATSDAVIAHLRQRAEKAERERDEALAELAVSLSPVSSAIVLHERDEAREETRIARQEGARACVFGFRVKNERDAAREALRTVRKHVLSVSYYVDSMTSGGRALGLIARAIDAQIDGNTVVIGSDWSPTYPALESKEA